METIDFCKLKGRIKEKGYTQADIAIKLGMTNTTLSLKLNNVNEFKQSEIRKLIKLLDIPAVEIGQYFFKNKVQ